MSSASTKSSSMASTPTVSSPAPVMSKINSSIPLKEHITNAHSHNCSKKIDKGTHIEQNCVHRWHKGKEKKTSKPGGDPIPMGDCRCGKKPKLERFGDAK